MYEMLRKKTLTPKIGALDILNDIFIDDFPIPINLHLFIRDFPWRTVSHHQMVF